MVSSTILGSAFGAGYSCFRCVRAYGCPFSINPPAIVKYHLFLSIQIEAPNISFVLSTGLVNNPLIFPRFWNSMLDRYTIENCRVSVLINPIERSPCFHNSSSVYADEELCNHGLRFIVVSKPATRQFPMTYLSNIEFHNRGDMSGLLTRPVDKTKPVLGAFVWMDWNRRYFIFTGGSMEKGSPYTRTRWMQEDHDPNAYPNMVELIITQTITAELYYSACGKNDRHNRFLQESIDSKKSWVLNIC